MLLIIDLNSTSTRKSTIWSFSMTTIIQVISSFRLYSNLFSAIQDLRFTYIDDNKPVKTWHGEGSWELYDFDRNFDMKQEFLTAFYLLNVSRHTGYHSSFVRTWSASSSEVSDFFSRISIQKNFSYLFDDNSGSVWHSSQSDSERLLTISFKVLFLRLSGINHFRKKST